MYSVDVLASTIPNLYGERPAQVTVNSVLVRDDNLTILIDTGLVGDLSLAKSLEARGLTPGDVDIVIVTHVHPDHCGNNRLFKRSQVLASKTDYEFQKAFAHEIMEATDPVAVALRYYPHLDDRRASFFGLAMERLCRLYWSDDVLGDSVSWTESELEIAHGVQLVATPGHTLNHFSVLIGTGALQALVTGDVLPSRVFFRSRLKTTVAHVDPTAQENSRKWVDAFSGIIIPGHDRPFLSSTRKPMPTESFPLPLPVV